MSVLVLVGHGSDHDPRVCEPVDDHAETLRSEESLDAVREAFVKAEPALDDVLASITDEPVVVVPVFATAGYFADTIIPQILADHRDRLDIRYTEPVGTHEDVTDVILQRIETTLDGAGDEVGVALVGHGSERHPESTTAVRNHATRLRESGAFPAVKSFFLEEPPAVEAIPQEFSAERLVVVPCLIANGHHVREDIPSKLGLQDDAAEPTGRHIQYTDPVGTHPGIPDIVLDRARSALEDAEVEKPAASPTRSATEVKSHE